MEELIVRFIQTQLDLLFEKPGDFAEYNSILSTFQSGDILFGFASNTELLLPIQLGAFALLKAGLS
jgi:hypothetical protein